jgi:hypothetical protein
MLESDDMATITQMTQIILLATRLWTFRLELEFSNGLLSFGLQMRRT